MVFDSKSTTPSTFEPLRRRLARLGWAAASVAMLFAGVAVAAPPERPESAARPTQALPEPSASARELFNRYKDRLVQVRVLLASASEQASIGSGFVVRDDGSAGVWVVTNFHVISALAMDGDKYRIELRTTDGRAIKADLVAVDVAHDLAVLKTDPGVAKGAAPWPTLALREAPLAQGARVYAMGNPIDLGFLISEGAYNGSAAGRLYPQMMFSGALNPGMSGGPAIDAAGAVVGVNVAKAAGGEQLSFLVPVRFVGALLQRVVGKPATAPASSWRQEVGRQLQAHQAVVARALIHGEGPQEPVLAEAVRAPPPAPDGQTEPITGVAPTAAAAASPQRGFASQTFSGRRVPTLAGGLTKCWAGSPTNEQARFSRDELNCSLRTAVFASNRLQMGSFAVSHSVTRSHKLNSSQFLSLDSGRFTDSPRVFWSNGELAKGACTDGYFQGGPRVYRVSACLMGYRKFPQLYAYRLVATQVDNATERLVSTLELKGFDFDATQQIGKLFLGGLQ